ncbi:hypothetical protein Q7A53_05515 [Halobacillus rhizosphaerae]|uniref:helix-turn-helix domain-containing protein n=1 Tax=Halobacillus rhizosphaerae TaxID=3064889 RepID=UPI00398B4EB8
MRMRNNLNAYLAHAIGKKTQEQKMKVTKRMVMEELASYCGVGWDTIKKISREVSNPSVEVEHMIARYFEVNVEDIFYLED